MKKFLVSFIVFYSVVISSLLFAVHAWQKVVTVKYVQYPNKADIFKSVHIINMTTSTSAFIGICTGVSVGPHALMLASHCEEPSTYVSIDGKVTKVAMVLRDENDHTIFLVPDVTFKYFANMNFKEPFIGERVFLFGSAGTKTSLLYREGYYSGKIISPHGLDLLFVCPIISGDSGSPVFDMEGNLQGIVSANFGSRVADTLTERPFMAESAVLFSKKELLQAVNFK